MRMIESKGKNSKYLAGGLMLAAWTIIGLISTGQLYTASYLEGTEVIWWRALVWQMAPWYLWILLTPVVRHFGRQYRITARHWRLPALHHVALSILLSLFGLLLLISIRCIVPLDPARPHSFGTLAVQMTGASYHINVLIYWMILGIGYAFDYQKQIAHRERLALDLEKQLAQAQLHALQMQLQPHFLFNTLNAITVLVRDRDNESAVRMLTGLSDLLRIVLSQSMTQTVTLREEIEFIHKYLEIEQTRFEDRLIVHIDVSPETLPALVPNFILQPLVENAVKHGISQNTEAGMIEIFARSEGDKLLLSVRNDGPSLSDNGGNGAGIGIRNTRERLEKLYGEGQQFLIQNAVPSGVTATLSIPLQSVAQSV